MFLSIIPCTRITIIQFIYLSTYSPEELYYYYFFLQLHVAIYHHFFFQLEGLLLVFLVGQVMNLFSFHLSEVLISPSFLKDSFARSSFLRCFGFIVCLFLFVFSTLNILFQFLLDCQVSVD